MSFARALSLLGCLCWGALALQVASPEADDEPISKPEFPAAELLAWAVNFDDEVLMSLQTKITTVVSAVRSFARRVEDVHAQLEQMKHLIDPEVWQQVSGIAKGISNLASGKHHKAHKVNHTKVKRVVFKQTMEERQREPHTREQLHKDVERMFAIVPGSELLGGMVSSSLVPEVMHLRRKSGPQQRLLMDKLANISLDGINFTNFSWVAVVPKVVEVAEALAGAGYERPARLVNISLPVFQVLRDAEPLLTTGEFNLTNAARVVLDIANLPPVKAQSNSTLRPTLLTLSRLLKNGAIRPTATSEQLLRELHIDDVEPIAPAVADFFFLLRDAEAPLSDSTLTTVLSRVAGLINDVVVLPADLAAQLNYPMNLVLTFACSLRNSSEAPSSCQAAVA